MDDGQSAAEDVYADICADLDYPMVVVTASDGPRRSGCLVGFSSQCSLEPPLLMVWVSRDNHTHDVALAATHLGVHFLSHSERPIGVLFGSLTGDSVDKFARIRWRPAADGTPVLEGCARWVVGRVVARHATGDHTGFLLSPVEGECRAWDGQLSFSDVSDVRPGHPK
ncbi:MAG TPA: flavin reductase family protein [Acidimicrobiales bacterium]|nr:flavin reductase family protein [Acidimicrobiales bacterium]